MATPSKSILYFRVIPRVFESTSKAEFPPWKIISFASFGILLNGSLNSKSNFCAINSSCLKTQFFFWGPCGANAPFLIDKLSSGTILLRFTSYKVPNPLQFGHIPLGELKEKLFGSGFGYEIPVVGHIKERLKNRALLVSLSKTISTSSP